MKTKPYVGQTLYFVYRDRRMGSPRGVTVTRVGRKWAEIGGRLRIDVSTWEADGGDFMPPGQCYASKDEYDAEVRLANAWLLLRNNMPTRPTGGVTIDDIAKAAALLGLPSA